MKLKTTLILLILTLISGQALADHDRRDGYYYSENDRSYYKDRRYSDRPYYGRYQDDRSYGKKHRHNRGYGNGSNGYRSNSYAKKSRQPGYRQLMNFSPERFARWYADAAISQVERAHYSGCRVHTGKGRWTSNWNDHYRHGRKARRHVSIAEVETRERELRQCGRYGYRG